MAEKDIEWENDLYIISDDQDWEEEVLKELKARRPGIRCKTRKGATPGSLKVPSLVESVKVCKKVVAGFKSTPSDGKTEFAAVVAVENMLANRTIKKGKLIPVKLDKDAKLPEFVDVLTVADPNDEGFYDELLKSLDIPEIIQSERNDSRRDIIAQLNLQDFYPGKLTCEQALVVSRNFTSPDTDLTNESIPWVMLHYLLMCNYNGRCLVGPKIPTVSHNSDFITGLSNLTIEPQSEQVSPADTLVALFLCCDNFLRQLLVEKLSMCQLAIPIILPFSDTDGCSYEMLLWALSTLRKKWKNSLGKTLEKSMVVHPLPIVSFLRLGKCKISKSKVLNSLVFGSVKHDMFFHYGCKGGPVDRKISDGLVEIGWYLPTGKNDAFPHPLTVLNLRGNASNLKKQTSYLSEISQVTIAFLSSDTEEEEDCVLLESLYKQNGHFILAVNGQPKKKLVELIKKLHEIYPPTKDKHIGLINCCNKNEIDISENMREDLSLSINEKKCLVPNRSIEECADIAKHLGFFVDEQTPDCFEAKKHANDLVKCLKQGNKKKELPLQSITLEIADKKKEEFRQKHRGNKPIEAYKAEMQKYVSSLRQQQRDCYQYPSVVFERYRQSFKFPSMKQKYFFKYVKILTDRYTVDTMQPVHEEYIRKWNELCEAQKRLSDQKKNEDLKKNLRKSPGEIQKKDMDSPISEGQEIERIDSSKFKSWKKNLDCLECRLADLSLGIEHFNREIGQVYEMTSHLKIPDKTVYQLPDSVAKMLLDGHPLELMDGDASHVPLSWIKSVFDSLINLIGEKRMFVLSVIGVQSSGKSTMLNAMFGLQFNVRAGRCTKGIFANLVKVDGSIQQETDYDYILVVDTEGLRSGELASIEYNNDHDNELATLVIGVGDLTIINIMGENANEMQDTLQIVVHVFMKMNIVNIKPSCIFVHHNVTDIAASDLNATQKRKLTVMLDDVTKSTAQHQNYTDKYQCFSDIIKFHENQDVLYSPGLWQGSPPMAPIDPGYSESIVKVKQKVIDSMKVSEPRKITEFKLRLSSVWNAILCEDFVFSFRSVIEIIAHNALETEYVKHSRKIRCNVLTYSDMIQRECKTLTFEAINAVGMGILKKNLAKLDEDMNTLQKTMEEYFTKKKDACQWKVRTEQKSQDLYEDLKKELTDTFTAVKQMVKSSVEKARIIKDHEADVLTKARELANTYRERNLIEKDLRIIFDTEWNKWLVEIPVLETLPIEPLEFQSVAREACKSGERRNIIDIFANGFDHTQSLVTEQDINTNFVGKFKFLFNITKSQQTEFDKARTIVRSIRLKLTNDISSRGQNGIPYSHQFGVELFKLSREYLEKRSEECSLKKDQILKIAVRIFCSLKPELEELQHKYRREIDPREHMKNQKETLWKLFKNECQKETMVIKISSTITDELESAVKNCLPGLCITGIIKHMPRSIQSFANKMSFHAQVIIDLAEDGNFEAYRPYLTNPFECMKMYINKYIKNKCCSKDTVKGYSVLENIYLEKLSMIFSKIDRVVDVACQQKHESNLNTWWKTFSDNISSDLVVRKQLMFLNEYGDFDVEDLKGKVKAELIESKAKLTKAFGRIIKLCEIVHQSQLFFEKDLLGCQELCPFCKAPCDLQTKEDEHRTSYHRPQGVSSYHNSETKKLVINLCTTSVSSNDATFKCEETDWKPHLYKKYQEVNDRYKSWKIQPMAGEPQLYWKWFMKTYNKQLAKYYEVEPAEIPVIWNDISWESAKEDMMKTYNL